MNIQARNSWSNEESVVYKQENIGGFGCELTMRLASSQPNPQWGDAFELAGSKPNQWG